MLLQPYVGTSLLDSDYRKGTLLGEWLSEVMSVLHTIAAKEDCCYPEIFLVEDSVEQVQQHIPFMSHFLGFINGIVD